MENKMPYYVTYKCHDEKGRRLAIFALPTYKVGEPDELPSVSIEKLYVYIIACSKKDTFSRKKAKELFDNYLGINEGKDLPLPHPIKVVLEVKENKPKYTFLKWCNETYFKYKPLTLGMNTKVLARGGETLPTPFKGDIFQMEEIELGDEFTIKSEEGGN